MNLQILYYSVVLIIFFEMRAIIFRAYKQDDCVYVVNHGGNALVHLVSVSSRDSYSSPLPVNLSRIRPPNLKY